jgi:ABC-type multidrug transport system fused ATPase/permease subunit
LIIPHPDPGTPDARSPGRYLWWLVTRQPARVLRGAVLSTIWMVALTLPPYLISRAVDDGLSRRDFGQVLLWAGAVLGVGIANSLVGIARHRTMTLVREDAALRTFEVLMRQVVRLGATLPRKVGSGEVVSAGGSDLPAIAMVLTLTGPGVGAVMAYGVVVVLLWTVSPALALLVGVGVPAITVLIRPLLRRLEQVESTYRSQHGALTARAGDIVAGLRVLSGIGGRGLFTDKYRERSQALRAEGYRVGAVASWVMALALGLPGLFVALVTWLAARMAATGVITVGEMAAVYGYVATLGVPVYFLVGGAYDLARGRVAARRVINILNLTPDHADERGADEPGITAGTGPDSRADLHDPLSGLTVPGGMLLGLAADEPAEAHTVAGRLGRYADTAVTWGGIALAGLPVAEVRRRILVADNDAYLFAGVLRDVFTETGQHDDTAIIRALHTSAAEDILPSQPYGLDTPIDNQARTLSGGQRQRVRLARALLTDPEVLILLEPTSAVDAHTEARMAQRLKVERTGRTTVVVSTSPLLLTATDQVAYLVDGRVAAAGRHADLLASEPGYRALVSRALAEDQETSSGTAVTR